MTRVTIEYVLGHDPMPHAELGQIFRQHVLREAGLLLVEVHDHELEAHGGLSLQAHQHVEQRVGVLAAREAHHDEVAVLDHPVVADRLAREAAELGLELLPTAGWLAPGGFALGGGGDGFGGWAKGHDDLGISGAS
jgi:hypothetical protein